MIGDPKQPIYSFRGADIYTYLQARKATAGRHYTLGTNYRSSKAIVEAAKRISPSRAAENRKQRMLGFFDRTRGISS